jgi:LPXTG-motif cell wall-anchored protein
MHLLPFPESWRQEEAGGVQQGTPAARRRTAVRTWRGKVALVAFVLAAWPGVVRADEAVTVTVTVAKSGGNLPKTGFEVLPFAILGIVLLLAGGILLGFSQKMRRHQHA